MTKRLASLAAVAAAGLALALPATPASAICVHEDPTIGPIGCVSTPAPGTTCVVQEPTIFLYVCV